MSMLDSMRDTHNTQRPKSQTAKIKKEDPAEMRALGVESKTGHAYGHNSRF